MGNDAEQLADTRSQVPRYQKPLAVQWPIKVLCTSSGVCCTADLQHDCWNLCVQPSLRRAEKFKKTRVLLKASHSAKDLLKQIKTQTFVQQLNESNESQGISMSTWNGFHLRASACRRHEDTIQAYAMLQNSSAPSLELHTEIHGDSLSSCLVPTQPSRAGLPSQCLERQGWAPDTNCRAYRQFNDLSQSLAAN